eukprot:TRINITY_DN67462_c0_g1_i1.p1 TRINITY_DN67462_c0_g1~~TRINITY_DN67462_c0_g1_i1.p1  ORF type:complete len:650 (+),score=98.42 TRINITY_DN67462_c0_g1_i1:42-1952(+)
MKESSTLDPAVALASAPSWASAASAMQSSVANAAETSTSATPASRRVAAATEGELVALAEEGLRLPPAKLRRIRPRVVEAFVDVDGVRVDQFDSPRLLGDVASSSTSSGTSAQTARNGSEALLATNDTAADPIAGAAAGAHARTSASAVRGLASCRIFLCPLGGLSSTRRRLLERRVVEAGGVCFGSGCAGGAEVLRKATHFVVDSSLPVDRLMRAAYEIPQSCEVVRDSWLIRSLEQGVCLSEANFHVHGRPGDAAERVSAPSAPGSAAVTPIVSPLHGSIHSGIGGPPHQLQASELQPSVMPEVVAKAALRQPVKTDSVAVLDLDALPEVVGLDCEFIGVGKNTAGIGGDRNALARVSIVAPGGVTLLDTTVKVTEPVVDFRIHITGLTQAAVDEGVSADVARAWVAHLLGSRLVVGHAMSHDWKVLGLFHPPHLIRDTARWAGLRPPGSERKVASLTELAEVWLGRSIQDGVHDSVQDASTALDLYLMHREAWEAAAPPAPEAGSLVAPGPPPPRPEGEPPRGALALVAATIAAARRGRPGAGINALLAADFERRAARSGAARHASLHYRRVARTIAALPYPVQCEDDLDRPELKCLGRPGCHTRRLLMRLLQSGIFCSAAKDEEDMDEGELL